MWVTRVSDLKAIDYVLFFGIIGLLPLLYQQGINLAQRPHFQFFPLSWGMFIAMVWLRGAALKVDRVRCWAGSIFIGMSLVTSIAAILLFSPWLAQLAAVVLCLGWMYSRLGGNAWHEPIAWISLLLITVPLPMNLDARLIQELQSMSTQSADQLMDVANISHLRRGNILEVRSGELFVDEACSGVDSLYALTAVALAIVLWNRQRFLTSVITLASIPIWAWQGNLLRIFSITWMLEKFQIDLTHGWKHSLLGLLVFGASAGSLLLFQTVVKAVLLPFPIRSVTSNAWHALFNKVVCWPGDNPALDERKERVQASVAKVNSTLNEVDIRSPNKSQARSLLIGAVSLVYVTIGIVSIFPLLKAGTWRSPLDRSNAISADLVKETFSYSNLANEFPNLVCNGFTTSHRETGSVFGEHSATWQFQEGLQTVQVSVDFPFPAFHRLESCYTNSGQKLGEPMVQVSAFSEKIWSKC